MLSCCGTGGLLLARATISRLYLIQLPLRGFPEIRVHSAPKGLDQGVRIHIKGCAVDRIQQVNCYKSYEILGNAHMDARFSCYRRERKKE